MNNKAKQVLTKPSKMNQEKENEKEYEKEKEYDIYIIKKTLRALLMINKYNKKYLTFIYGGAIINLLRYFY